MLSHVNRLAMPHPGQDFTRVVPQVSKAHSVPISRNHAANVSQICGYK
jgi:hypothetical protein